MIITRTPFRVSLFGGGSDYPDWYLRHGGCVLGFAINKYCYISLRPLPPFFAHRHRVVYSVVETVRDIADIQHPAVRHVLQDLGIEYGVEIHHDGDLPARSGLGSSSSFTVGLIHALHAGAGRVSSKELLAREAIRIEQEVINEAVGSQDQVWAAYGGMNRIDFQRNGVIDARPLILGPERKAAFLEHFLLFFSGISRFATEAAARQIANLDQRRDDIRAMMAMVDEAQAILADPSRKLIEIGHLLHEGWRLKRGLAAGVSNEQVDSIYAAGRAAGAVGGKLLGAGGGGFVLFYAEPDRHAAIRAALPGLVEVSFDIDHGGSKIVVYEPDGLAEQGPRPVPARGARQPASL